MCQIIYFFYVFVFSTKLDRNFLNLLKILLLIYFKNDREIIKQNMKRIMLKLNLKECKAIALFHISYFISFNLLQFTKENFMRKKKSKLKQILS